MMKLLGWVWRGLKGTLIALGLSTLITLIMVMVLVFRAMNAAPSRPDDPQTAILLTLTLDGAVRENPATASPLDLLEGRAGLTLHQMISAIRLASRDDQVRGLYMTVGTHSLGLAQIAELSDALAAFRQAGKRVVAYSDGYGSVLGGGNRPYLAALAADEIIVNPVGMVALTGINARLYFLKDMLEQAGIGVDVFRFREPKSIFNFLDKDGITPAQRRELDKQIALVDDVLISTVADRRGLSPADALDRLRGGPYTGEQALDLGLVDGVGFGRDATAWFPELEAPEELRLGDYLGLGDHPDPDDLPRIAVVFLDGTIGPGGSEKESALSSPVIQGNAYAKLLEDLAADPAIGAIVVRINSGGGSPLGSEIIRHALAGIEDTPVIVSMGNLAASGGYWIALGGDTIFAHKRTLTGSIGVTAALPNIRGLSERLGIRWEELEGQTSANGQWHYSTGLDAAGRARLQNLLEATYQQFITRVADARDLTPEAVEALAQGQVWTGEQALERGLVDQIGDLRDAIRFARTEIGLEADARSPITAYPRVPAPIQQLQALLSSGLASADLLSRLAPYGEDAGRVLSRLRPLTEGGVQALADPPLSWE